MMSKFKCKCLNVTIHVKEKVMREASGEAFVSDACVSAFFAGELYEVELAVGGITKEVGSLVQLSRVEDWDVFTCINCSMETHALHAVKKYDRVLVNKKLEGNSDVLNKRTSCPQYSRIFKIILDPLQENELSTLDNSSVAGNAVLLGKDNISVGMASVQEQTRKFLETEEKAMTERIRKFVEEQRSEFAALQSQVNMDKQAIHWAIRKAEEKFMEKSLHEAIADASLDSPILQKPQMTIYPASIVQDLQNRTVNQVHITQVAAQKYPLYRPEAHTSYGVRKVAQKPREPLESDADAMFRLDDFTDDCEPFFESEEDDLSSDNSFQSEEPHYHTRFREIKNPSMEYSSSAPIRMPMGKNSPPDDDAEFAIPEPSKIRESMKAIARSLHDNSKEQFGELPRSRTTTYCYR